MLNDLVSATFTKERKSLSSINPIFLVILRLQQYYQKSVSNYKIKDYCLICFRFCIKNANFSINLSEY
nr:MAG TPA_asm: hypothetical protein [Caudoviricetes sp.]